MYIRVLGIAILWSAMSSWACAMPIEQVQVNLSSVSAPLPVSLEKRMNASVKVAAMRIFEGRDTEFVESHRESFRKGTEDIINRLLYGYIVEDLQFHMTQNEKGQSVNNLSVQVRPYGDVVESVHVRFDYGNLTPKAQKLLSEELKGIENRASQILVGTPLDSTDWSYAVAQSVLRQEIESVLPEFVPQVHITGDTKTDVIIYLIPQGAVIRKGITEVESSTLPATIFYANKQYFDRYLEDFVGIPVAFVARHEPQITQDIRAELAKSTATKRFSIDLTPSLAVGETLRLLISANSSQYIVRGEAFLDMGREKDHTGIRIYTGARRGKQDFFLETQFLPSRYVWRFWPSYAYHVTQDSKVGFQFNLKDSEQRLWLQQDIKDRWHLRIDRFLKDRRTELSIGYDIHHYITVEAIQSKHERWIRLIGRL